MVFDDEDVGVTPAVALQDVGVAQGDDEMSSLPALWRCKGVGELGRFSTTRRRRHTLSVTLQGHWGVGGVYDGEGAVATPLSHCICAGVERGLRRRGPVATPLSHCKDAGEWAGVATTRYASLRSSLPPPWHCKGAVELACFFDDVAVVVTPLLVALQDGEKCGGTSSKQNGWNSIAHTSKHSGKR